jgi:hypothetical protein
VDVDSFLQDGFVAIRQAVDAGTAAACRELIWQSMARRGLRWADPTTSPGPCRTWPATSTSGPAE